MARLVRIEGTGPFKVEPQDKPVWVCGCGLSKTLPFCDGTHKGACREETPGILYVYDDARTHIVDQRPDAPSV